MRKVILQMAMSLDGFVADAKGGMDWLFSHSDDVSRNYVRDLLEGSDLILLGRGMAAGFLDYWPTHREDNQMNAGNRTGFADRINSLPKIIFSKTMKEVRWPNVTIASDIATEISKQKQLPGKNIILYGGAGMARSFANLGLIDEYHLVTVPVILGSGLSLFTGVDHRVNLQLVKTTTNKLGVVIFHLEPRKP